MPRYQTLAGSYLRVGTQLAYHYVAGSGKPLLFIHGARSDVLRTDSILRYFTSSFKIYAPDLPGFGKSPPGRSTFDLVTYAEFIRQYIRTLNLKDFCLVGASMGGVIAIHALKPNDLPVKKVVLLATPYDRSVVRISPLKLGLLERSAKLILSNKITLNLFQKIVDSDRIMYPLVNRGQPIEYRRPEIIKFELRQWRVVPMEIHLRTMIDTVNVHFAQASFRIKAPALAIYPEHDHYINNEKNLVGLARIFETIKPLQVPLKRHVPPGRTSLPDVKELAKPILSELLLD